MSAPGDEAPRLSLAVPFHLAAPLALVGGVLYFVGFAGFDVWPCAFVAQALLVVAIRGQTPRRAAWLGFLNGLVLALGGFYWLLEMLRSFAGFGTAIDLAIVLVLCAYQGGGRIALLSWLTARAEARGGSPALAYAGAFTFVELLYPLLFPYYAGASLHRVPLLLQVSDLGGPILVGLVLVAVNLAVAELALAWLTKTRLRARVVYAGAGALALTLAYGAVRIRTIDARVAGAERATVGIIQANMGLKEKRLNAAEGVRRHRELTSELEKKTPLDFAVWSESAVMYTVPEDDAAAFLKKRVLAGIDVPLVFGSVLFRDDARVPGGERLFNTALATDAQGAITGRYDKQYLLMFGEYLPLADTFPVLYRWSPNSGRFTPGTSLEPVRIRTRAAEGERAHRAAMLICYEDILPAFVRAAVRFGDPELLVNVTNDAWFGDTTEPWEHFALAKLRAIEHRRFLVRSTNSGVSAIVDPVGRVTTSGGTFRTEALAGEIRWLSGHTVYERVGDAPFYLMAAVAAWSAFGRRRRGVTPPPG